MAAIDEVCAFLKEAGTYYLATIDGDKPSVRPFGTAHIFNNRLYIQTGRSKDVYKQLKANPKAAICACDADCSHWLRIDAEFLEDQNIEAEVALIGGYPDLQGIYMPGDGNMVVFYMVGATATFSSFTEEPRTVMF